MASSYSILVGTTGAGLFQSPDGGENWSRIRDPFPGESQIRALASDPQSPNVVYAGSNNGIYRSEDSGSSWVKLDSPMDGLNIWSIAVDPQDSDTIFAGTSPGMVFRTKDGGKSWKDLSVPITQECARHYAGGPIDSVAQDGGAHSYLSYLHTFGVKNARSKIFHSRDYFDQASVRKAANVRRTLVQLLGQSQLRENFRGATVPLREGQSDLIVGATSSVFSHFCAILW